MIKCVDFNQYKEDTESGVKNFTKDGKCSQCGSCCSSHLAMTPAEIERIRRYIKKNNIKEQKHLVPSSTPVLDLTCPFRNDSIKKCMIYEIRPQVCRDFFCGTGEPVPLSKFLDRLDDLVMCNLRTEFYHGGNGTRKIINRAKGGANHEKAEI